MMMMIIIEKDKDDDDDDNDDLMFNQKQHLPFNKKTHLSIFQRGPAAFPAWWIRQAYTRLGFDPREAPEEALTCQVILFKDEAFRGRGVWASDDGQISRSLTWFTWKWHPGIWNRRFLLETIIFRFHVKFGECTLPETNSEFTP